ncbi:TonB-dependent receptor [Flammeovirgaceae bacterium SG7u.111]|nr:TonB-dependent receptor [Flammeovirgaceae bacterium SG7u.132]WPO33262.1 TonB-dependent receptor [Flammeovirgaceae bacterium SG7u.111]
MNRINVRKYCHLLIFSLLMFFGFALTANAQQKVTLSGYLKDAGNGEDLIGGTVYFRELKTGGSSNVYGFYSVSVPPAKYTVEFRYIGYGVVVKEIDLTEDTKLDVELVEEGNQLEEVVVQGTAEDDNVTSTEISVNKLEIKTIKKMPALLGEVDLIRSIQLLPGVSTVGEGASGFNVRGGDVGQNLVLLDEAPVYNSSHLFGFFSVFNPDAVKDVKLVKGGIPAQYGGRLSSLLDVRMKEGNSKKLSVNGGIGAIFSRLAIEAPIVKDKSSFIVAGRRSYADVLAAPFLNDDLSGSAFNFYDLTLKANYDIDDKNRIYLSGYFGKDNIGFGEDVRFNWGNGTGTFRWNHLFNDRLFSNLSVFYSDYDYELGFGSEDDAFDWSSKILNYNIKPEFTYYINTNNTLTFGGQATYYDFKPGDAQGTSAGEVTDISLDNRFAIEGGLYVGNEQKLGKVAMSYGLRLSYYNYIGEGTAFEYGEASAPGKRKPVISETPVGSGESIADYLNLEPRMSIKYQLDAKSSIKASYNRMVQYVHLLSNTTATSPLDVWTPTTNNIAPEIADQVAVGYFRNFKDNTYEFSVEAYYKDYRDLVEYIDNADLLLNKYIEGDLISAIGRAYGAEFYLKKSKGKLNGWVSYTLARTERKAEGINNGEWYAARFDQRHNLTLVGFYDINKRWTVSANLAVASGTPATYPTNRYEYQGLVLPQNYGNSRNGARIPAYHRLDLSATLNGKTMKKGKERKNRDYWVFSIYNVYGRRNPYSVYVQPVSDMPTTTEAVRLSIIGTVLPSVSYNFQF